MNAEEFFKHKFGNELKATDSWVIRFAEEFANQSKWLTEKPNFTDECLLITANYIQNDWEYNIYQIRWIHSDEGKYLGWCTGEGEEYDDLSELNSHLYQIQPLPEKP